MRVWRKRKYRRQILFLGLKSNPDAIVICDELGNGIVPIKKQERIWREQTGAAYDRACKSRQKGWNVYYVD